MESISQELARIASGHSAKFAAATEAVKAAELNLDMVLKDAIEGSKPLWTLEVAQALKEFDSRPTYVPTKRSHARTTDEERDAIFHFAFHGLSPKEIANKFAVSMSTVYLYGIFDGSNYQWFWMTKLQRAEHAFKKEIAKELREKQRS